MFESIAPSPKIDDKEKQQILNMIREDIIGVDGDRSSWLEGVESWRKAATAAGLGTRDLPWPGAADHRHDMIPDEIDDFVARGMNILFGDSTWAPAKPTTEKAADRWDVVENFMQWALENDINFWPKASDILRSTVTDGVCFVYTYWHRSKRNVRHMHHVLINQTRAGKSVRLSKKEIALSVVSEEEVKSSGWMGDYYEIIKTNGDVVKVWIAEFTNDDNHAKVEVEETRITKDRPEVRILDPNKVWTPELGTLDDTPFINIEFDVTLDWLKSQRATGAFNLLSDEDWQKILDDHVGKDGEEAKDAGVRKQSTDTFNPSSVETAVDDIIGVDTYTQHSKTRPFRMGYYQYDLDKDSNNEDVVFIVDPRTDTLMAADYRTRRVDHGKLPISMFQFIRIPNRTYVPGLPYWLSNVAVTINTLMNQAIDGQSLANLKFGFYDQMSAPELADKGTIKIRPAELVGVNGPPREIIDFQSFEGQDFDKLMPFVDKLETFGKNRSGGGGFGPNSRAGQNHNTPRTFGGTHIQLLEGQVRQAYLYKNIANGLQDLFGQIFALYSKLMAPSLKFRVSGKKGFEFMEINRDDLQDQPDFIFAVNALSGNKAVRQSTAMLLFQTVGPFLSQLGAQEQLQELLARFLKAYDEPKPEGLIPSLPNMMKTAPRPQWLEDNDLFNGIPVEINPMDDDAQHIQEMIDKDQFLADRGIVIHPDILKHRETHRFQHIAAMEQKMAAGPGSQQDEGGRPMGGERRLPGQNKQQRPPGGGTF